MFNNDQPLTRRTNIYTHYNKTIGKCNFPLRNRSVRPSSYIKILPNIELIHLKRRFFHQTRERRCLYTTTVFYVHFKAPKCSFVNRILMMNRHNSILLSVILFFARTVHRNIYRFPTLLRRLLFHNVLVHFFTRR